MVIPHLDINLVMITITRYLSYKRNEKAKLKWYSVGGLLMEVVK